MYKFEHYYKDKFAYIKLVSATNDTIAERRVRLGWGFLLGSRVKRAVRRLLRCEAALVKQMLKVNK
jgi:hypothetical protein